MLSVPYLAERFRQQRAVLRRSRIHDGLLDVYAAQHVTLLLLAAARTKDEDYRNFLMTYMCGPLLREKTLHDMTQTVFALGAYLDDREDEPGLVLSGETQALAFFLKNSNTGDAYQWFLEETDNPASGATAPSRSRYARLLEE